MTLASACGINCRICEQFVDKQCSGCFESEEKQEACEAYQCVRSNNYESCYECTRVTFCKKRKRAVERCFVFHPGAEFRAGGVYLIEGSSEEAYLNLAKQAFAGKRALFLAGEETEFIKEHPALEDITVHRLTRRRTRQSDLDIRNPEVIVETVRGFVEKGSEGVVLLDSIEAIVNCLGLKGTLRLLTELREAVASSTSCLLLREGNLKPEEREEVQGLIANFSTDYIIKSVSNPKRKEILDYLRQVGKASFSELYRELRYTMPPKLSFHLKILKDAGVIEQDKAGIYYISALGREVDGLLKKMQERVIKGSAATPAKVREEFDRYTWYKDLIKKSGSSLTLEVLQGVEDSMEIIFGKEKSREILHTVLAEFIEGEKEMSKEDLRRAISEIAFVFLVDIMPLVDSIDWADELLVKHELK
jgi:DNA-binding transcriptional ArsR family regulator